ncbi:MAG: rhomboid family intramembrane serine protease [bacterium]|nr:rhomboid family intramembrane serine protease [bacterium]
MHFSRRFGYSDDPWFRIGGFPVSTTAFVVGLGVVSMIIWGVEGRFGPIFRELVLVSESYSLGSVQEGDVWRLITWPIPNEPDFWTIILFAIFYMLGSQLESLLGRWRFAFFLVCLTLVPSVIVTAVEAAAGIDGYAAGLRMVEVGVLVAFAAQYAQARFWPGIPGWVIAVVVVGLDTLQALGNRDEYSLIVLACTVSVALLGIRAFGYATNLTWIPKLSLAPSSRQSSARADRAKSRRRSRSRDYLRAVPTRDESVSPEIDALLDQVASQGLDSLTRKQRKQLEAHARRLRRRH